MPQTLYDYGGSGTLLHMAVANGFPPATYAPLLQPLTERYRVLSLPPRALWTDPPPPESFHSWRELADDLLAGLDQFGLSQVVAVGHSFGAIGSMMAAVLQPARFRGLVLLDPTLLPPHVLRGLHDLRAQQGRTPLADGALKRKARFDSMEEAFTYWRGKALFADWPDDALHLYTESLLRPVQEGGWELVWSPEWEAHYYDTVSADMWEDLPKLSASLPVLMIRGTTTNTLSPEAVEMVRRLLPQVTYREIEGHGHLFPHTAPHETRLLIEMWLEKEGIAA